MPILLSISFMGGITDIAVLRGHTPHPQFAELVVHDCTCGRCDKAASRSAMASGDAREFVFAGCFRWKDKSTILLSTKNAFSCSGSHVMFDISCPLIRWLFKVDRAIWTERPPFFHLEKKAAARARSRSAFPSRAQPMLALDPLLLLPFSFTRSALSFQGRVYPSINLLPTICLIPTSEVLEIR